VAVVATKIKAAVSKNETAAPPQNPNNPFGLTTTPSLLVTALSTVA